MEFAAWTLVALAVLTTGYTYLGYPLLLRLLAGGPHTRAGATDVPATGNEEGPGDPPEWPKVTVTVPAFNEEAQIADTIEHLLRLDYPRERLRIVIVSDASTDGTDAVVKHYESHGVELRRMPVRRGKTAAENAVAPTLEGEIVVNTDASIRIEPSAIKALVRELRDPSVGLASGRDVSVAAGSREGNQGESGYVGYEMGVRALETRTGGIVGASGCLYAIRADLQRYELPENLSRDFAAALVARERGYRAVSVDDAVCFVPRTASLRKEYRRKVRTMTRGIRTLAYKRTLLNPGRYGLFSWKLFSHKVCRWGVPWTLVGGGVGAALLAWERGGAAWFLMGAALLAVPAVLGWGWPASRRTPRGVAVPAHLVWSNVAALHATVLAPLGGGSAVWEPTRRKGGSLSAPSPGTS